MPKQVQIVSEDGSTLKTEIVMGDGQPNFEVDIIRIQPGSTDQFLSVVLQGHDLNESFSERVPTRAGRRGRVTRLILECELEE